jgi:hypothetical protein
VVEGRGAVTGRKCDPEAAADLTTPIGYGSRADVFKGDPWDWLDEHRPDLEFRCTVSRRLVGHAWRAPDTEIWYRSGPYQGLLDAWLTEGEMVPLVCPVHSLCLLPAKVVVDAVVSRLRTLPTPCRNDTASAYPGRS